ncbi:MAG: hypothetical protein QXE79_08695 [Candidatus Bathyarchaeia archaeon]
MLRRNIIIPSAAVILLIAVAFLIGTLYLPYGEKLNVSRLGVSGVPTPTPAPTPKLRESLAAYEYGANHSTLR